MMEDFAPRSVQCRQLWLCIVMCLSQFFRACCHISWWTLMRSVPVQCVHCMPYWVCAKHAMMTASLACSVELPVESPRPELSQILPTLLMWVLCSVAVFLYSFVSCTFFCAQGCKKLLFVKAVPNWFYSVFMALNGLFCADLPLRNYSVTLFGVSGVILFCFFCWFLELNLSFVERPNLMGSVISMGFCYYNKHC